MTINDSLYEIYVMSYYNALGHYKPQSTYNTVVNRIIIVLKTEQRIDLNVEEK